MYPKEISPLVGEWLAYFHGPHIHLQQWQNARGFFWFEFYDLASK